MAELCNKPLTWRRSEDRPQENVKPGSWEREMSGLRTGKLPLMLLVWLPVKPKSASSESKVREARTQGQTLATAMCKPPESDLMQDGFLAKIWCHDKFTHWTSMRCDGRELFLRHLVPFLGRTQQIHIERNSVAQNWRWPDAAKARRPLGRTRWTRGQMFFDEIARGSAAGSKLQRSTIDCYL